MQPALEFDPGLAIAMGATVVVAILTPLIAALVLWLKTRVSWKYFLLGAVIFFISQILIRLPILSAIQPLLAGTLQSSALMRTIYLLALALTAGLFEEVGRWIGYKYLITKERTWRVGVMYGLGHGGIESIVLVGLSVLSTLFVYIAITLQHQQIPIPAALLESLRSGTALGQSLAIIERISAIIFHVALSLIVMQSFTRHSIRWLWYAIAYHAFIDYVVAGILAPVNPYMAEAILALNALIALWIIIRLRHAPEEIREAPVAPPQIQA